ncbi:MAG: hypothetical protein KAX76_01040, partial [Comamonas sp.]|nr:hypothetical protein [Comamonas sp.]
AHSPCQTGQRMAGHALVKKRINANGALVLWCFGALVLWCFNALVRPTHAPMHQGLGNQRHAPQSMERIEIDAI